MLFEKPTNPTAAPTAADEPELDFAFGFRGRLRFCSNRQTRVQSRGRDGCGDCAIQELTAREPVALVCFHTRTISFPSEPQNRTRTTDHPSNARNGPERVQGNCSR